MRTSEVTRDTRPMISRRGRRLLLGVAAFALVGLALGVVLDYRSFDRTSGGYEPPYTDWTGTPIDWDAAERTMSGFRQSGIVINSHLDCTTGMIALEVLGMRVDYRTVSARAIAVHQPREACTAAGFDPAF